MIDHLIAELGEKLDLTAEELADVIWLTLVRQEGTSTNNKAIKPKRNADAIAKPNITPASIPSSPFSPAPSPQTSTPTGSVAGIVSHRSSTTKTAPDRLPIKVANPPSLRNPLALARSLRPLMRQVPSGRTEGLDEQATAQQIAEARMWQPIVKPLLEPWLEIALIADESASMLIWRQTVLEFRKLLRNYGAFRDVQLWGLHYEGERLCLRPGIGSDALQKSVRQPEELLDPNGRRLILLITDCVSPYWQEEVLIKTLKRWARQSPVAIAQVLPEWLWVRTAIRGFEPVQLTGLEPGVPSSQLIVDWSSAWLSALPSQTEVCLPIVPLEPDSVLTWSQMVMGQREAPGYWLRSFPTETDLPAISSLSPEQQLERFKLVSSPVAQRLMGLVAASPVVTLPVIRLIQETLLPKSQQMHVAEVLLSGLLEPITPPHLGSVPDEIEYRFVNEAIRDLLLAETPVPDTVQVLSDYVERQFDQSLDEFVAELQLLSQNEDVALVNKARSFATVTAAVLKRKGGRYREFVQQVERQYQQHPVENTVQSQAAIASNEPDVSNVLLLEEPGGQVPLDSVFYIERPPIEADCYETIAKPGALIRIKAPRQMGKSSLMLRILSYARQQGHQTACLNFQTADAEVFTSLDQFLQWFCASVTDELHLDERLSEFWQGIRGSKTKCTNYFQRYLLPQLPKPLTLALDEVDRVFQNLDIAQDFFGLLRTWHEYSKNEELWRKLRLIIVHSREVYTPLSINQSPFNVGLPIELPMLTQPQVIELIRQHGLTWTEAEVSQFMNMVGGHPYLVRVGLYTIARGEMSLARLLQIAPTESGPYSEHLHRHLLTLDENENLLEAMQQVLAVDEPVRLTANKAFGLANTGLVQHRGNEVVLACDLYRHYFRERLTTSNRNDTELETTVGQSLDAELRAVLAIVDEQERAGALAHLMSRSPEAPSTLLQNLLTIEDEVDRASALITLIPQLPSTLLSGALEIVRSIQNTYSRFQGLAILATLLPEVVPEALQAGLEIEDESTRLRALTSIVEKLPSELLPQALEAALTIDDAFSRARALIALTDKLPNAASQALEAILEIENEYTRAHALRESISHLPSNLISQALDTALGIQQGIVRDELLRDLMPLLPEDLQQRINLVKEAPSRTALWQKGTTQISAICTSTPWDLPLDALVIPVGYQGGLGNLAAAFQDFLGISSHWLSQAINDAMRANKLKRIRPEQPLLVQLPLKINSQVSSLVGSTSKRFIICATSESEYELSSSNTSKAYEAVIRLAVDRKFRRIVIPLIGTGANQLPVDEVATGLLRAINSVLKSFKSTSLEEITIADRDEDKIATIARIAQDSRVLRVDFRSSRAIETSSDAANLSPNRIQNRWALLVGIDDYSRDFSRLNFCVKDVQALETILEQLGYTVVCLHDHLDRDDDRFPTKNNIEAELLKLCQIVGSDDLLWVHFACHGTLIDQNPVLIARDTRYATMEKTALALADIENLMRDSKAKRLVITLDACHVGVEIGRDISDPEFIRNAYDLAEGFALIAGSTTQQVAQEWKGVKHGVFTYYLLEGLTEKADHANKGFITVNDLQIFVIDHLRRWNIKYSRGIHEPAFRTSSRGDFILSDYRNVAAATTVTAANISRRQALDKQLLAQQLNHLQEDYEAIYEAISSAHSTTERRRLERRAEILHQEIADIENKLNQL